MKAGIGRKFKQGILCRYLQRRSHNVRAFPTIDHPSAAICVRKVRIKSAILFISTPRSRIRPSSFRSLSKARSMTRCYGSASRMRLRNGICRDLNSWPAPGSTRVCWTW